MQRRIVFLVLMLALTPIVLIAVNVTPVSAGGTVMNCSNDADFSSKLNSGRLLFVPLILK